MNLLTQKNLPLSQTFLTVFGFYGDQFGENSGDHE